MPDCEVKSMVSYTGPLSLTTSCCKGTIIGACRLPSRAVLAPSVYCLRHLTPERERERSLVFSCQVHRSSEARRRLVRKTPVSTRTPFDIISMSQFLLFLLRYVELNVVFSFLFIRLSVWSGALILRIPTI